MLFPYSLPRTNKETSEKRACGTGVHKLAVGVFDNLLAPGGRYPNVVR